MNGVIYVGADMVGNFLVQQASNISFTGTIIVGGNLQLQQTDTVTLTYDPDYTATILGFSGGSGGVNITAYSDWKELQ